MKKTFGFISDNRSFFFLFFLFLLFGGLLLLNIEQGGSIIFFSERRTDFGDLFFRYFTKMGEPIAYFLAMGLLLFVKFRYALVLPLIGILVTIVSFFTKDIFNHDRPLPFFTKEGTIDQINLVEGVVLNGGPTSFPSGHTMSAFALYGFLAFILSRKKLNGVLLFSMALLVGFSRIYLVQHFFKDIYLGAIMGVMIAWLFYLLAKKMTPSTPTWLDGAL